MIYHGRTKDGRAYRLTFRPIKFLMVVLSIICAFAGHWVWAFFLLLLSDFELKLKWS